ncbi:hypothetical protein GONAM_02_00220 [Gordonia namibiensis NBRC 108229]|uniref:site-specific DNA-methyltransferase (adenine-specific) n=1 Tax=Gordonia namibiensis NBRC 108229 TaxID=1208314 RepID=K6WGR9_9ACTN|nr:DUF3696 domain-containing protein [Gordonia namibiensis]GAB98500.1 hypothetical protein GONAM_02_00220 [Gordonia namibiensis NBRC 108229]
MNDHHATTSVQDWLRDSVPDIIGRLGVERGVDLALRVIFARWATLQSDSGHALWNRMRGAISDEELVKQYRILSVFKDENNDTLGESREAAYMIRKLIHEIDAAIDPFTFIGDSEMLCTYFDSTLELLDRLGKQAGEADTPPALAVLMAELSVHPGDYVVDPVCGNGTGLIAASRSRPGVRVAGLDINLRVARRARMRFLLNDIIEGSGIDCGDALDYDSSFENVADVVIAQPPWNVTLSEQQQARIRDLASRLFDPRNTREFLRSDMPWVLLALDAMHSTGRAALILSGSSVSPSCRLAHELLLDSNVVEAILALPAGMFTHTGVSATMWLLRAPDRKRAPAPVLMVDMQPLVGLDRRGRPLIEQSTQARVVDLVSAFRDHGEVDAPANLAVVLPRHQIDTKRGLHPKHYLEPAPKEFLTHPEPKDSLLTEVSLTNFKAFGDRTSIPLAPLTLIYGANSSGKSSVIQSLLLIKQSMEAQKLVTQGPIVNVGSFGGITHGHVARHIEVALKYGVIEDWIPDEGTADPALSREVSWVFQQDPQGQGIATEARWRFGDYSIKFVKQSDSSRTSIDLHAAESAFLGLAGGTLLYPFDSRQIRDGDEDEQQRRLRSRESTARRVLRILRDVELDYLPMGGTALLPAGHGGLPALRPRVSDREEGVVASYLNRAAQLASGISNEVASLLNSIVWLGPLRSAPKRVYDRADVDEMSGDGRHIAVYLFDHATVVEQVNEWLVRLEVPYKLDVVPVTTGDAASLIGELVAIALTDRRSGVTVTPADVGFGISQVLPIVVELLARRDSVIAIEQPETHLHPRLQARLADLLIDSAQKGARGNQILVETHSEHLMLRVQRRIREGALDRDLVSVLYVDQDSSGSGTVKPLRLDSNGEFLDEWPDGFFDERLEELFGEV